MDAAKFAKQKSKPNPLEVDYWVDLSEDPRGSNIKYFNGYNWVTLTNKGNSTINLNGYYDKASIDKMMQNVLSDETIEATYQKKLIPGENITIDEDNVINVNVDSVVSESTSVLDKKIDMETLRAIAVETRIENRVDQHYSETDSFLELKADKSDTYTKQQIDSKLSGVYKIKGSIQYENLPITGNMYGDVYNITNDFVLYDTTYPAGTNIVFTEYGWDVLSGVFDTTSLEESIQTVSDELSRETLRAIEAETYNSNGIIGLINDTTELATKLNTLTGNVYTKAEINSITSNYLPLSGGTLTSANYAVLNIKRDTTSNIGIAINFLNNNGDVCNIMADPVTNNLKRGLNTTTYTIWDSGNDGANSGLDADLLDGNHANDLSVHKSRILQSYDDTTLNNTGLKCYYGTINKGETTDGTWCSPDGSYNGVDYGSVVRMVHFSAYYTDIFLNTKESNIKYRQVINSSSNGWKTIATLTDNVASATKLQTARTIWGKSFDGTGDITGNILMGTKGGGVGYKADTKNWTYYPVYLHNNGDSAVFFRMGLTGDNNTFSYFFAGPNQNTFVINNSSNIGIGTSTPSYKLHVEGDGYFNGSVRLTTVRDANGNWVLGKESGDEGLISVGSTNLTQPVFIGNSKGKVYLNSNGNVTIGSSDKAGSNKLYVDGTTYSSGSITIANGRSYKICNSDGVGKDVMYLTTANKLYLGVSTAAAGYETNICGNNIYFVSNSSLETKMIINTAGNVGVGVSSPSAKLHVNGDILATGTITQSSQRDLKDIVDEQVLSIDDMSTINPTRFKWKDNRDDKVHYGGIAEDIQQVIPEVVHNYGDTLTVEYANAAFVMVTSLVKHVKELTQRISELEKECEQLRNAINL